MNRDHYTQTPSGAFVLQNLHFSILLQLTHPESYCSTNTNQLHIKRSFSGNGPVYP